MGYTSLREQYIYRRAAQLYQAAFKLDPSKGGRTLVAWLGRADMARPMEEDRMEGQPAPPPVRSSTSGAKKSRVS